MTQSKEEMTIADFKFTSRADMTTDIRDTLEIVDYIRHLEKRVKFLEKTVQELSIKTK
jgi:hypothetical protein